MLRIGIIGAGYMAEVHIDAFRKAGACEIVGVTGAKPSSLRKFAKKHGIKACDAPEELFKKAAAAVICLPSFLHEEYTVRAARKGLHVLCEKPIALDEKSAENMINACNNAGVVFMVAHCLRFWPEYQYLEKVLTEGKHGALLSLHCERMASRPGWFSRGWADDDSRSGGVAVDLHIHDADMILKLLGEPKRVSARRVEKGGTEFIAAEYFYPKGLVARAEAGWLLRDGYPFHMAYRAVFEKCVVEYDSRVSPTLTLYREGEKALSPKLPDTDGYVEQAKYFVRCAAKREKPGLATGESALKALKLVLKEKKSTEKKPRRKKK